MGKCRIVLRRLEYFGSAAGDHSGGFVILTIYSRVCYFCSFYRKKERVEVFFKLFIVKFGAVFCVVAFLNVSLCECL